MSDSPQTIGRYLVERILGRGSMGIVYKAHDPEIDRPVAVKLVRMDLLESGYRDDYLARFRREVQAAGRCMHPNIIAMYDFGSHEGNPFFVMEYVDAPPLDEALPKGAGLGPHGAAPIILQLLDALETAHRLGIVHRDIKPSNMLLTADRQIKVMDFGISHISTSHLTQIGSVLGTPRYMSPEQFRGDPVDARSDLFSTGAVLHELLTGRPPIAGRSFEEVMVKLLHDGIELAPPDPLMPAPMRAVVARALERRAEDRFDSAETMAVALRRALAEVEAGSGARPPREEARTVYRPMASSPVETTPPETAAAAPETAAPEIAPVAPTAPPTPPAAAPPPQVQADPVADPALADSEVLGTIERRLAQHIGPLAGRLVRSALKGADSVETLCQRLAARIDVETERESFLRDVHTQLQGTAVVSHALRTGQRLFETGAGAATMAARTTGLTADDIERAQADLTRYLGPFAKVLVKRAVVLASSPADLRTRLAEHLETPAEKTAFLAGR